MPPTFMGDCFSTVATNDGGLILSFSFCNYTELCEGQAQTKQV